MAFPGSTIEDIYQDIKNRQSWVGRLSLVEFDDKEYDILKRVSREIVQYYEGWWSSRQQKERVVFLAFAMEYVRRKHYVNEKFWDEFLNILHTDMGHSYKLITEDLLLKAYSEEDIKLIRTGKGREFVLSLYSEVKASTATSRDCIYFFLWYYQDHTVSKVTPELIERYRDKTGKKLDIHDKAIGALDRDCQTLTQIIEYAIEHDLFLAHSELATYSQKIIEGLGIEYDPTHLRLLHDKGELQRLIIQLQNHRTLRQFLRELEYNPTKLVQPPYSYATISRRQLSAETMPYGPYKLGDTNYRVVPLSWLRLETIAQWPCEEIISLRNGSYVGYKKQRPFSVKIGTRTVEARQCFFQVKGQQFYIWADEVPRGEPLRIDGRLYQGSAGLDWHTSLELGSDEDGKPTIVIVFNWLKVYYPDQRGQRLFIRSSQGHEESKYALNNEEGSCQLHRAFGFPLKRLGEPITIWIDLEEKRLASRPIALAPETASLFSTSTREQIPNGTKREWGEQHYYLFASAHEIPKAGKGVTLEELGEVPDDYVVYQATWEDTNFSFSLRVGDVSWSFEKPRYFYVRIKQQPAQGLVHLRGQQIHCFTQEQIQIWTNQKITSSSITCSLLYMGGQAEIQVSFQHDGGDIYRFSSSSVTHLNGLTVKQGCYGQFELFFYEEGQLLGQTNFVLIPEIDVDSPSNEQPLLEGKSVSVKVTSPRLKIWDAIASSKALSVNFPLYPALSVEPWKDEIQAPKGILCLTPQVANIPVTFPAIGATIEIHLRPSVFGFRLYQRTNPDVGYRQVNTLNYSTLQKSALYIHTIAHSALVLYVNKTVVWIGQANEDGNVIMEKLSFLKKYCQQEQTTFEIHSEKVKSTFSVRWTPIIDDISVEKDRVRLEASGPIGTSIVLSLRDINANVYFQQQVVCEGEHFITDVSLPLSKLNGRPCYLVPQYRLTNDTLLPTVWQRRIEGAKVIRIPLDWLRTGTGVSSETLLQNCIVE